KSCAFLRLNLLLRIIGCSLRAGYPVSTCGSLPSSFPWRTPAAMMARMPPRAVSPWRVASGRSRTPPKRLCPASFPYSTWLLKEMPLAHREHTCQRDHNQDALLFHVSHADRLTSLASTHVARASSYYYNL